MTIQFKQAGMLLLAGMIAVTGCSGERGPAGTNGTDGTNGTNGTNGTDGTDGTDGMPGTPGAPGMPGVSTGLKVAVTSVTEATDGTISVRFTMQDDKGYPIDTLGAYSAGSFSPRFGLAYVSKDAAGNVLPYTVLTKSSGNPTALTAPAVGTTNASGTLALNTRGDYTYTFPATVVYDAAQRSATHTLWIQASRTVNGADPSTLAVANVEYDYVPAGGTPEKREVVSTAGCNKCHGGFRALPGFHGRARIEAPFCNVCHNPARGNAVTGGADAQIFVHRIHFAEKLNKSSSIFHGINETTYPQDIRNCGACHDGAAQGAQWKTRPNRSACGSCHDNVDFTGTITTPSCSAKTTDPTTGKLVDCKHSGGTQTSDANCTTCHDADSIAGKHQPVLPPDPNSTLAGGTDSRTNAGFIAAANFVPAGADVITYDVKSVSRDVNKNPVVVFKLKRNGTDVVWQTYAAGVTTELMPDFVGTPVVYVAFAVPQDGITAPADFNATASAQVKRIWNGAVASTVATMAAPDAEGYYTVVLTGTIVPDAATMLTGGLGYEYSLPNSQPLTQTNLAAYPYNATNGTGGLIVPVADKWVVGTGYTGRRAVVSNDKCNGCHGFLGVAPSFHVGQRNDAPTCSFCHNPNRTSSAWSANVKDFVHGIHGAGKRTQDFTWHATATGEGFWDVTYPNALNNCQACHLSGTYDFSATASAAALPNLLSSTVGTGTYTAPAAGTFNSISPYVTLGTNYGTGFSFTAGTGAFADAAATTFVVTPITAACSACHDDPSAIAHMESNGGAFYKARSVAFPETEQCLVCHGKGKIAAIADVHAQ
jgi:OmcA/MtrC family decaheme c-type cytochrome